MPLFAARAIQPTACANQRSRLPALFIAMQQGLLSEKRARIASMNARGVASQ
jgi:hypothetical protein